MGSMGSIVIIRDVRYVLIVRVLFNVKFVSVMGLWRYVLFARVIRCQSARVVIGDFIMPIRTSVKSLRDSIVIRDIPEGHMKDVRMIRSMRSVDNVKNVMSVI